MARKDLEWVAVAGSPWNPKQRWGPWLAHSWAGQRDFSRLTLAPCPLLRAVRRPRFQTNRDVVENALGPESQICSRGRTRPLTSCETQGRRTSPLGCSPPRGDRSKFWHPGLCGIQGNSGGKSTSHSQELTRAQRQLSVGSGIRPRGFNSQFSQL